MSEDDDDHQSPPLDLPSTAIDDPYSSSSSPNKSRNCISSSGTLKSQTFPDHVLENVLQFLDSRCDHNDASLVCKSWWRMEALTRSEVLIGNYYALSPERLTQRFKRVRSLVLKGKPRFADFNLMPPDYGANFAPWVSTMAKAYHWLEKVDLKRIGIAIAANKFIKLKVLDLIESEVTDDAVDWISCFPEDVTCLESLAFDCVEAPINFKALESLVGRLPFLKKLRLNRFVSLVELHSLLLGAPQLTSLGTGSFSHDKEPQSEQELDYAAAFHACKSVVCLSGFRELMSEYLPAIFPVCANLTSLNFCYANISPDMFKPIILNCHKLQVFWALDSICDEGLQPVAATCKELRELRIFSFDPWEDSEGPVSELGLQAISEGCRKLESILYFCQHMTNAAEIAMSENCPELTVFRLCIMGRHRPGHVIGKPMDEGFGAIVTNCKKLTRLAVSGLLIDQAFRYMGEYGKLVRTLSVAFVGDNDMALRHVLEGFPRLQKLEIRDSPFGDVALRSGMHRYYNMRFVWMSACSLSKGCCKDIAPAMTNLVVEVIGSNDDDDNRGYVETLYMYRSLDGPRNDAPKFVTIL
ncbi:unnamed protein product [Arabidopsis arenosa]|uniref:F-box domain-containing protein n=1 Tax=Arabidopsis arenosa TaxID=38785 RepID=A0A8S2B1Z7_ARAAE|nr:unnamed protein product [Arabidopsis arenosa]